jgi:uncharacterized protein YbjT (DUF2867 family)
LKVLLAGATGLVGHLLLRRLEAREDVTSIDVVTRRRLCDCGGKIVQHMGEIETWPCLVGEIAPDVAISALGTTIRQAGSEVAFSAVDLDAVTCFARAAAATGARQFMLVSSVGAHASSRNFYLSTKGKVETAIQSIGFERVDIFRPGLLRGHRAGERRLGERAAILLSPITDFLTPHVLDHYRSIAADDVAGAIAAAVGRSGEALATHENRDMWAARQ